MKPQKPANFLGPGPELIERQKVAKERAAHRVRSWTVQDEMTGALVGYPQMLHEGFSILPILES